MKHSSKHWFVRFLLTTFVLAMTVPADAQSTYGTIRGAVRDQSQALVPGVTVTALNVDGNYSRTAISDANGNFEFQNLTPGRYELSTELTGFKKSVQSDIRLGPREVVRLDFTLQVGSVADQVVVTGEASLVNSETPTISGSKTDIELKDLPLNFRGGNSSPILMVSLVPGVQVDSGNRITLAGNKTAQNEFSIDGISSASIRSNGPLTNLFPSVEAISEIKVTSTNNNAEFAQQGDITTTSRGGTNSYHGSAFWYHQNKSLNAKDYFVPVDRVTGKKPFLLGNTFGGSVGGPILKNRAFFFADYEGVRFQNSRAVVITVPSVALRSGNFGGTAVKDPLTQQNFSNNQIPASRISPVSQKVIDKFYPLPNASGASNNYRSPVPQSFNSNQFDVRGDYVVSQNHSMFGRFTFKNLNPRPANTFPALGNDPNLNQTRGLTFSDNWSVTPRLLNEFRFGVTRSNQFFGLNINGQQLVQDLGLKGLPTQIPSGGGMVNLSIPGFAAPGHSRDETLTELRVQFANNMTWSVGKHIMKWGLDIRHMSIQDSAIFTTGDDFGDYSFDGTFTGHSWGDFLLGIPSGTTIADTGPDFDSAVRHYGFFWQDDWKVSPRLTLNYGVRYEYHPPFHDRALQLTNFDYRTGNVVVANQESLKLAAPGFVESIGNTKILTASEAGIPDTLRFADKNNLAPRFGFAFRPFNNNKTVIRGGYGVYTVTILGSVLYSLIGIHTADVRAYTNSLVGGKPLFQWPDVRAGSSVVSPVGTADFRTANDIFYRDPYSMQWSLTAEHEFMRDTAVSVSYVGSKTLKLTLSPDLNAIPPQAAPYDRNKRPFSNWNIIFTRQNGGISFYNGFSVNVRRRLTRGLMFDSSWYWSKNLSTADGHLPSSNVAENGPRIVDMRVIGQDYGDVSYTRRHRWLSTFIWDVPAGKGKRFLADTHPVVNGLLGGWQLSGIVILQTGPFFTPQLGSGRDPSGTNQQNRVSHRPDRLGNGNLSSGQRTINRWFDTSAFVDPASNIGRYGNAGVGILAGPGTAVYHLGVGKSFDLYEDVKLRFMSTFQNLFNHPNFGLPGARVRTSNIGVIGGLQSAEGAGPRTLQVSLRVDF